MSPNVTRRHLIYVADEGGQAVYIFPRWGSNQAPIGKITNGLAAPNGLFVDKARNLYVCNFGGGTVTVYPNGAINPSLTLTGAGSAIDVVVGVDGTVYVSNWDSGSSGTLLEYPPGQTTPSVTININGASEGLALDSGNNLYVAYNDSTFNDGEVLKFAPGATVGTNLGIHVGYVGGETIDSKDNLLLDDQNIPGVDIFPPGATQPSSQIKGFSLAFDIALNHPNTRLWVTDPFTAVYQVTYPTGTLVNTITNTITSAFGVAISPDGSD
jgi:sugar lactone lactonase YvrE